MDFEHCSVYLKFSLYNNAGFGGQWWMLEVLVGIRMMNLLRHVAICWCFCEVWLPETAGHDSTLLCSSSWLLRYYCMLCSALLFFLASAMYCRLSLSPLGVISCIVFIAFLLGSSGNVGASEICIACGFFWSPARFFRLSSCPSKLSCFTYVLIRMLWYITMWLLFLERLAVTDHYVQVHIVDFGGVRNPSWLWRLW